MDQTRVRPYTPMMKASTMRKKSDSETTPGRESAFVSVKKLRDQLMKEVARGEPKVSDRIFIGEMRRRGMKIPRCLTDSVIMKSKKGAAGQIIVKRVTGVQGNAASTLVKRFEANVGGKEDVQEKLDAVNESLPEPVKRVLAILKEHPGTRLPRAIAMAGADIAQVMTSYAKGALFLGQVESAIEAQRNMPRVVKDLVGHAIDRDDVCQLCYGTGTVAARKGLLEETQVCPMCRGDRVTMTSSKHKEFAVQKLLEITKMIERAPLVNVQQNVGVKVEAGAGALSKVAALADEILYGKKALPPEPPIEAEIIK